MITHGVLADLESVNWIFNQIKIQSRQNPPKKEGVRIFTGMPKLNPHKTHCIHNHPYTSKNAYFSLAGRRRQCKVCASIASKKQNLKLRQEATQLS